MKNWKKCSEEVPPKNRLILLWVDGDYEFGFLRDDDYHIFTDGKLKKRYEPQEVTHWLLAMPPA